MDGGAWRAAVHGVAEGWTQLSDFTFTFHFNALGREMATHSNVLAWRIPGMGDGRETQEGGEICIHIADSLHCLAETNTTLEKAVAPHSSTLAWRIPWTEEPGRLQSTGSRRVGHD